MTRSFKEYTDKAPYHSYIFHELYTYHCDNWPAEFIARVMQIRAFYLLTGQMKNLAAFESDLGEDFENYFNDYIREEVSLAGASANSITIEGVLG